MTGSTASGTSIAYGYDYAGQRVEVANGTSTTYYPETTYNMNGATSTKSIFANGTLAATIEDGTTTTVSYISNDNLGGSNVVTDASGAIVETLDYYPYGGIRIDNKTGSTNIDRKYIGQQYDAATQLSYLNARYYNGTQGQFISQDPMFLGNQSEQNLSDPQSLNAYGYSDDNPIVKSDPNGLQVAFGLDDLAAYAILTSPIWVPVVYNGVNAMSTAAVSQFAKWNDPWANSNSRQIQVPNINSGDATGGPGNNQNPQPGWKTVGKVLALTLSAGCELTNCLSWGSNNNSNSTPSINLSVGTSNGNSGSLYWTQPPSSNSTIRSAAPTIGPANGSTSQGGSSGLSQQQIQNLQSQINSIKNEINQIESEINAAQGSKK